MTVSPYSRISTDLWITLWIQQVIHGETVIPNHGETVTPGPQKAR